MIFDAGPSFDIPPAGAFVARCFRQIFLGTQEVAYSGDTSYRPLVLFGWELLEEPTADGKPHIVQKRCSASMHEKTTLRKDIDGWRGKKVR